MEDSAFDPATLTIKVGQAVVWSFYDVGPHTVTADDDAFSSGPVSGTGNARAPTTFAPPVYMHTFDRAGTFGYHCSIHPQEKGTIIVQ
jgi:plastocyanin